MENICFDNIYVTVDVTLHYLLGMNITNALKSVLLCIRHMNSLFWLCSKLSWKYGVYFSCSNTPIGGCWITVQRISCNCENQRFISFITEGLHRMPRLSVCSSCFVIRFHSRTATRLSWLKFSLVFFSTSRWVMEWYLKMA
jgi:hypothetical protein